MLNCCGISCAESRTRNLNNKSGAIFVPSVIFVKINYFHAPIYFQKSPVHASCMVDKNGTLRDDFPRFPSAGC
jgi:hypothetical protein